MTDLTGIAVPPSRDPSATDEMNSKGEVVSTHVLVSEDQVERLRELSRRTRVAQSEYLREAVEDLLSKYETVLTPPAPTATMTATQPGAKR